MQHKKLFHKFNRTEWTKIIHTCTPSGEDNHCPHSYRCGKHVKNVKNCEKCDFSIIIHLKVIKNFQAVSNLECFSTGYVTLSDHCALDFFYIPLDSLRLTAVRNNRGAFALVVKCSHVIV